MKTTLRLYLFLLMAMGVQAAPPANDQFTAASDLETTATGTNAEASAEAGEPGHANVPAERSVWWRYTASADGLVEVRTAGSAFDTRMGVYTGETLNTLTAVGANNDQSAMVVQSRVLFSAVSGTVYYIAVDGVEGATGQIELEIARATPPRNDDFAAARDIGSNLTASDTVYNGGATGETGEPPHAGRIAVRSLWWVWTAPASGDVRMDTIGSAMDTVMSVRTGSALTELNLIAQNDDGPGLGGRSRVTVPVVGGMKYYIAVDALNGVVGDVTLNVEVLETVSPPLNDHFADAAVLPRGIVAQVTGTNDHATREAGEGTHAGNASAHTVWWSWTPYASGPVRFTTEGSDFDTVLAVYTGSAVNALTQVAFNDDINPLNSRSALTFNASAGTVYRIAVGGYFAATGDIVFGFSQTPVIPDNDAFASRSDLGTVVHAATTGVNLGATAQSGEPDHAGNVAGRSVWWQWASPVDEFVTVTTEGSSFDTVVAVYTGSALGALQLVTSNDDEAAVAEVPVRTSRASFFAPAGVPFLIAVDGKGGASGGIVMSITEAPPPSNDDFEDALELTGEDALIDWHNYDATTEPGEPDHAGTAARHSVWWRWTAPKDGVVILSAEGSGIDTRMAVYKGTAVDELTLVMANDDEPNGGQPWSLVRFRAHGGETYFIAMDGNTNAQGQFLMNLEELEIEVDNDRYAARVDLGNAATVSVAGTNIGASAEAGEPAHRGRAAEASIWWQWTAPATAWMRVSIGSGDFNRRVGVYTGDSVGALVPVNIVQAGAADQLSVNFRAVEGEVYSIAVDGIDGSEGLMELVIGPGQVPSAPGNDQFAARTTLASALPVVWAAGANTFATAEEGEPGHGGAAAVNSVWYRWTAQETGRVTLDGSAMAFAARLAVYTGSSLGSLSPVVQSTEPGDERLTFLAQSGTVYAIAVDTPGTFASGGSVAFTLDYAAAENDVFAQAAVISGELPQTVEGFNVRATAEEGEPAHAGNPAVASVWWQWTCTNSELVTIETAGSEFDTVLAVYTGGAVDGLTLVISNDQASRGDTTSRVTFPAVAGTVYQVAVDGFRGATGGVILTVKPGLPPTPPVNDNFSAAIDLGDERPVAVTGTNANATAEAGEPEHAFNAAVRSVWWKWTAPVTTTVSVNTLGSSIDTVLAVYTGTAVDALTLIEANDDATGGTLQSGLSFAAVAGTSYYIAVDGFNGASGALQLTVNLVAPPNDQFANRRTLGNAVALSVAGTNAGATTEAGEPEHAGRAANHTVWWSWTAPVTMDTMVSTLGADFDPVLAVYTGGSVKTLTLVESNDNVSGLDANSRVVFRAVAGMTYHLVVGSAVAEAMGDFGFTIARTTIVPAPANDAFAAAADLASVFSATINATSTGATAEAGEPSHAGSLPRGSVWWRWTAPFAGTLTLDTAGSAIDTRLAMYSGSSVSSLTLVASNDDGAPGLTSSRMVVPVVAGTSYAVVIDGFAGALGAVRLNLVFAPGGSVSEVAYASWAGEALPAGIPAEERGLGADPDKDGVPNGVEYLMGLDAAAPGALPLAVRRGNGATVLEYPRATGVPDGFEGIEGSADLVSWTVLSDAQMTVVPPVAPSNVREVTIPDSAGYRFFRLVVRAD